MGSARFRDSFPLFCAPCSRILVLVQAKSINMSWCTYGTETRRFKQTQQSPTSKTWNWRSDTVLFSYYPKSRQVDTKVARGENGLINRMLISKLCSYWSSQPSSKPREVRALWDPWRWIDVLTAIAASHFNPLNPISNRAVHVRGHCAPVWPHEKTFTQKK